MPTLARAAGPTPAGTSRRGDGRAGFLAARPPVTRPAPPGAAAAQWLGRPPLAPLRRYRRGPAPSRPVATAAAAASGPDFNRQTLEVDYGGRKITIETGEIGRQAGGAVTVTDGETIVYATACAEGPATAESAYGIPFQVTYSERFSAAGRTAGSFIKRDGRPRDHEVLAARLIDRPLRPCFPAGWASETQVLAWVLSYDGAHMAEPLAITAAGAALAVSDIPIAHAVAGARVGLLPADAVFEAGDPPGLPAPGGGWLVVNPTVAQVANSSLDLIVAGTSQAVLMMEGYCDFLSDEVMAAAVEAGAAAVATVAAGVDAWAEAVGARPKREDRILPDPALLESVRAAAGPALVAAYSAPRGKATLSAAVSAAKADAAAAVGVVVAGAATPAAPAFVSQSDDESPPPSLPPSYATFSSAFKAVQSSIMRAAILDGAPRSDGRAVDEVRPIGSRAGLLPRAHGSALFTRGETQALAVATLGPTSDAQRVDGMTEEDATRRFYLQYFFPPSSVGETGRMGGPGRREIGHGALAERALAPSVPPEADFPYTIRVESTITESNGSSSMASVCGGCLAMLDAGVPLKRPIAGVAMGLILEPGVDGPSSSPPRSVVLTDILGSEDALGDMDFKVAGDADGITAFQMDIKVEGITLPIIRQALAAAGLGRRHILATMEGCDPPPRRALAPHAPRILRLTIPSDKVGALIGPGGRTIRGVMAETGCSSVQVLDSEAGLVELCDASQAAVDAAAALVRGLTSDPAPGEVYQNVRVASVERFGLIVEFMPGRTGLCHVSELGPGPAPDGYSPGDRVDVMLLEASDNRFKLSRKAALEGADVSTYGNGGGGGGGGSWDGGSPRASSSSSYERTPPPPPPTPPRPLAVGELISGAVSGIATFGVFLDVGGGRSGLIHVSELADAGPDAGRKSAAGAAAAAAVLGRYARGDRLEVVVLRIGDDGRIDLSEKLAIAHGSGGVSGDGSAWAVSGGEGEGGGGGGRVEAGEGPGTPRREGEGGGDRRRRR